MTRKKKQTALRGGPSALVVSITLHVALILAAGTYVAIKVIPKKEVVFEGKQVVRPKMKLQKLQVPVDVKKKPKPKEPLVRQNIVANTKLKSAAVKLPKLRSMVGGAGSGGSLGFGNLGFRGQDGLFGGLSAQLGSELTGTFYDLKRDQDGTPTEITSDEYIELVREFSDSWDADDLDEFFQAPKKLYSSVFMIPNMPADEAPKAYGVGDIVEPRFWVAHYKGRFEVPESGSYRFCGLADDVLLVRVKRDLVLDASWWNPVGGAFSDFTSHDEDHLKWPVYGNTKMRVGEWVYLKAGKPFEIEILIGERPGGEFSCMLLIQKDGEDYRQVPYGEDGETRPVLPVFKLADISSDLAEEMKINPDVATLEGPIFGVR